MKIPPLSMGRRCCAIAIGLSSALAAALGGCSSSEPAESVQVQPSVPGGPAAPGGTPVPDGSGTYGLPGPEPVSEPPESDGPGATETNFLTPPCRQDSDCPDGRRCVIGEPASGPDAGDTGDAGGGPARDAGLAVGFCERNDGG